MGPSRSSSPSVRPERSSITMKGRPRYSPVSRIATTFRSLNRAAARTSSSKRRRDPDGSDSEASSALRRSSLIATDRASRRSSACLTSPKAPRPMTRPSTYRSPIISGALVVVTPALFPRGGDVYASGDGEAPCGHCRGLLGSRPHEGGVCRVGEGEPSAAGPQDVKRFGPGAGVAAAACVLVGASLYGDTPDTR